MPDLQSLSALVLEDEFIIAMDLRDMLLDWGFGEVHVAYEAEEARGVLSNGGVDVVLADFQLPDGTSADLIGRAQGTGSAVIVLTGQAIDPEALASMGRPAVLEKPVHPDALREALLDALARSRVA